jgi:hypothetical protein
LIVYDQCQPKSPPQSNTLFIGRLPPETSGWKLSSPEPAPAPQIIDTDRLHPLMQLIDLGNVEIAESLALDPPPGGEVLIDSSRGHLCAIAPRGGFEDAVLGFEIVGRNEQGAYANTNWPLRLSFPTFVLNAVEYLGGQSRGSGGSSARPGEVVELKPETPVEAVTVRLPDGQSERVAVGRDGAARFTGTTQLGVYRMEESSGRERLFAVNLLDGGESNLTPRDKAVQIGFVEVDGQTGLEPGRREIWKWLLAAALVVLLAEWYIYNRRVYL